MLSSMWPIRTMTAPQFTSWDYLKWLEGQTEKLERYISQDRDDREDEAELLEKVESLERNIEHNKWSLEWAMKNCPGIVNTERDNLARRRNELPEAQAAYRQRKERSIRHTEPELHEALLLETAWYCAYIQQRIPHGQHARRAPEAFYPKEFKRRFRTVKDKLDRCESFDSHLRNEQDRLGLTRAQRGP